MDGCRSRISQEVRAEALRDRAEVAQAYGARELAVPAQRLIAEVKQQISPAEVMLTSPGGFTVTRRGTVVPASAWQSRKARDLLKVLMCRRGRPIHREQLMELLWPDEDPKRTGNRLSWRCPPSGRCWTRSGPIRRTTTVRADEDTIVLNRVEIDVERLLEDAAAGLRKARLGATAEARAHLDLVRLLARHGRHGEARRRYRLYGRTLGEIGVEAAPYPVTGPRQAARSAG